MNLLLTRALLAVLPLLGLAMDLKSGLLYGGLGAALFLASSSCFLLIERGIPAFLHRLIFFLILFILSVKVMDFFLTGNHFLPFLLPAGIWFLTPPDLFKKRKRGGRALQKMVLEGLLFAGLLGGHGALSQLFGGELGIRLFQSPAGSYLLLGLAWTVLPKKVKE